jgi:hypothetical protein
MENYLARLVLTSELDDPIYFAKVHQTIADLEKQRVAQFNEHGPMNKHYLLLLTELNAAYADAKETERELEIALRIYETNQFLYGEDDELTLEALLALAFSYLDDAQNEKAQGIATALLSKEWDDDEPHYYLYARALALQADIKHVRSEFTDELILRKHIFALIDELLGSTAYETIMCRCALAICQEKLGNFREALDHYIVVRSWFDAEPFLATEAEKVGLMVHIARCYRKIGRFGDASVLYHWAHRHALKHYGDSAPLTRKTKRIIQALRSRSH